MAEMILHRPAHSTACYKTPVCSVIKFIFYVHYNLCFDKADTLKNQSINE